MKNRLYTEEEVLNGQEAILCNIKDASMNKRYIIEYLNPIPKQLENGKVYKNIYGHIFYKINESTGFGFSRVGFMFSDNLGFIPEQYEEYPLEDFKALLITEAEKRGFKSGVYFKSLDGYNVPHLIGDEINFWPNENDYGKNNLALRISADEKDWGMNDGKGCSNPAIFKNGQWAEIVPTITKKEAEQKLRAKIID